jgi:Rps23 Pro-64 3,4-dihydroxylase Tpa1-like proline 4-hydroxylase
MPQLTIELKQEPFPHAIIRNFYDQEELSLIWRELDFLTSPHKLEHTSLHGSNGTDKLTGLPLSKSLGLSLDKIYNGDRKISDILRLNRKIFQPEIIQAFESLSPLLGHLKMVNEDFTKIKYYENGNYYRKHTDDSRFTTVTYFHKEPKAFTGGDLHFDEYDYTIPIENNMLVFFVGCIEHSSLDIKMNGDYPKCSGYGKYVMNQFLDFVTTPKETT